MPIKINNRIFRIKKTPNIEEYQVVVIESGKRLENLTYYTNDKEDARGTLRLMVTEYAFKNCEKGTFRIVH